VPDFVTSGIACAIQQNLFFTVKTELKISFSQLGILKNMI